MTVIRAILLIPIGVMGIVGLGLSAVAAMLAKKLLGEK